MLVAGATWTLVERPDPEPTPVRLLDADDVREADEGWDYDALSTGGDDPTEFVQLLSPRSALTRESTRPGLDLTFFGDRREHVVALPAVQVAGAPTPQLPAFAGDDRLVWLPREPVPGRLQVAVLSVQRAGPERGGRVDGPVQADVDLSSLGDDLAVSRVWLAKGRLWFLAGDRVASVGPVPGEEPRTEVEDRVRAADLADATLAWVTREGKVRARSLDSGDETGTTLADLAGADCRDPDVTRLETSRSLVAASVSCAGGPDRLVVDDLRSGSVSRLRAPADVAFDVSSELLAVVLPTPETDAGASTYVLEPGSGRWVRLAPAGLEAPSPTALGDLVASSWGAGDEQDHLVARVHPQEGARPASPLTRTTREALGLLVGRGAGLDDVVTVDPGPGWWPGRALAVDVMLDPAEIGPLRLRAVAAPLGTEPPASCGGRWRCARPVDGVVLLWREAATRGRVLLVHRDDDGTDVLEVRGLPVTGDPRTGPLPGLDLDDLVDVVQDPRFGLEPDRALEAEAADYYGLDD